MNHKLRLYLGICLLNLSVLPLYGMDKVVPSQEKFSLFQDAPITDWKATRSIYDNAYQGAKYGYSLDTNTYQRYLRKAGQEERGVIEDWVHAVQNVEKELLVKPFEAWTIEDIKQISAWLTRSSGCTPGALRTQGAQWLLQDVSFMQANSLQALAVRKAHCELPAETIAQLRNLPEVKANPTILTPLSQVEAEYLHKYMFVFPVGKAIEEQLTAVLMNSQAECASFKELSWEERQQHALSLGCKFHYEMVRIHPFSEGAKRLGRLCMFIIHSQNGIRPLCMENADTYMKALQDSLSKASHKTFEEYFRKVLSEKEAKNKSQAQKPATESHIFTCAQCGIQGQEMKCCSICKSAVYCGKDCQTTHWKAGHKSSCKAETTKKQ